MLSLKQIILLTDGHANKGCCPILAASEAKEMGITVSAIGILDSGQLGRKGQGQVEQIVDAGGGICYFVTTDHLAYTMHSITVQATRQQAKSLVSQKLKSNLGIGLEDVPPKQRNSILPIIEKIEEEMKLELVVVIDTSGSMTAKRKYLERSIRDLILSLNVRAGAVKIGVVQFPDPQGNVVVLKTFNNPNCLITGILQTIRYGGLTPTGPGINTATKLFRGQTMVSNECVMGSII